MGSGIYIATAGAKAQSEALDVVANNVANAATTGFRAQRSAFREALNAEAGPDMRAVVLGEVGEDVTHGALRNTGNPLDLALQGDGFFAVTTVNGERYTRAGEFRIDQQGKVVDRNGNAAVGVGGEIVVPPATNDVAVASNGTVTANGVEVGQLKVARFTPENLVREGDTLYRAEGKPVAGDALPEVVSGAIELSNVNVVRNVVDLVRVSRTYQALTRMIEGYKDVESRAARALGGPK